jgi:hypothetical protein
MPNCFESLRSGRAARCAQFVMASLVSSGMDEFPDHTEIPGLGVR